MLQKVIDGAKVINVNCKIVDKKKSNVFVSYVQII